MARVITDPQSIDLALDAAQDFWDPLPELAVDFDALEPGDQDPYLFEGPHEESRLRDLEATHASGKMSDKQTQRYHALMKQVKRSRPLLEKIVTDGLELIPTN